MVASIEKSSTQGFRKQKNKIVIRHSLKADMNSSIPDEGEIIHATDTNELYIGDGLTKVEGLLPISGGGSGSNNYNDLLNKPQINGVTLIGNKTSDDLGIITPKYLSVERLGAYIYKATFDVIPEYDPSLYLPVNGSCTSFVRDGKLYRNYDWKYDNTAEFLVVCKDFQGISSIFGMNDGALDVKKIEQLPYHVVDGVNKDGIMVSTHVLYNDWTYAGAGDKDQDIMLLPYYILNNLHDISNINTVLANYVANIKIPDILLAAEYLLHFVVTDGTTTYCIMPPTNATGSYVIQDITSNPKLTNFRWVSDATVVRTDLQTRPTGVERWNEVATSDLKDLRFTKCYEAATRLSEFIGIDETTKDSTDAELTAIYDLAHAEYQTRTRDGKLWQTVHSVVFGSNGIEHLWCQEDFNKDYCASGGVSNYNDLSNKPQINGITLSSDKTAEDLGLASAAEGALAASAIQPGDDISDLNNDAGYITGINSGDVTSALGYTPVNPSNLATVATTGDYDDLVNKPTIPAAQIQSDWEQADTSAPDYIKNKPYIPEGVIVDQTYDPTSTNAQSGTAVAEAVDSVDIALDTHIADKNNPHEVTKAQVGLGNVDNTSDLDKPISTATQTALNNKVTKNADITGATKCKITYDSKGLVTAGADLQANDIPDISATYQTKLDVNNKLSTDYISGLATVATSGSYSDLANKPTIPAAQVNSDWTANSGVAQILNKPTLSVVATSGDYDDLLNKPYIPTEVIVDQTYDSTSTNAQAGIAVAQAVASKVDANNAITGGTATKITYDSKGLVTAGSSLQSSDIPDLSDTYQSLLVSGTNIKTINNESILGSGNLTVDGLPSQTGQSGKFLTTDGTDASWSTVPSGGATITLRDWSI